MSKEDVINKLNDQDMDSNLKNILISSPNRKLISVTDKAMLLEFDPRNPIMIDSILWNMYYIEGDKQFEWLYNILNFCESLVRADNTDYMQLVFSFTWEPIEETQFIHATYEIDEFFNSYYLLKLNEESKFQVLH